MELTTIEKPKGMSMPCRTLPENALNTQVAYLLVWLENLLGVKDNVENEKRIKFLFEQIKETAWNMSLQQIMEAFKLYVDGKLPIEPISGFIDTIHFKKVIRAYKDEKAPKMDLRAIALNMNDIYLEKKTLMVDGKPIKGVCEAFDYLYDKEVLPKRDSTPGATKAYNKMMLTACGFVIAPLIDKRNWMAKEELTDVPRFKELQNEIQTVRNQEHPDILPKFKQLILEGFFKKQKKHLKELI